MSLKRPKRKPRSISLALGTPVANTTIPTEKETGMNEADKIELMCRTLADHLKNKGELRESFTAKFIADQIRDSVHTLQHKPS